MTKRKWHGNACDWCDEQETREMVAVYAYDPAPTRYSKTAMRERLGVTGDCDE